MPVQTDVQVIEHAGQRHIHFANHRFLGGSTIEPNRSGQLVLFHRGLDRQHGTQGTRSESAVAAGMAGLAVLDGFALWTDFL